MDLEELHVVHVHNDLLNLASNGMIVKEQQGQDIYLDSTSMKDKKLNNKHKEYIHKGHPINYQ